MPNILCISSFFREQGGGVAQMAHCLARELANTPGYTVTLAAHVGSDPQEGGQGQPYRRLPIRSANLFERRFGLPLLLPHPLDLLKLRKSVRSFDAVIVHDTVYLSNLAVLGAAYRRVPAIVVKHTGEVRFSKPLGRFAFGFFARFVFPFFLRKASALAFVTQAKLDNFPSIAGVPMTVIPNGIDTDTFSPRSSTRSDALLFVGRFVTKKGIAIMRELARLMPERQIVIAGYGPHDPREWSLGNVICHWQPDADRLAELYSSSGAVILPGETEGTPLVALEALACEAPVVIGETGGSPDPVLDRQMSSLPVDIDRPEETARLWRERLEAAVKSSTPDRAAIVEHYSTRRMTLDYLALIEKCRFTPAQAPGGR